MNAQVINKESWVALYAPDGSWQGMTLAPDMATCIALIKLLHKAKMGKSYHELTVKGYSILPVSLSIIPDGTEEQAFQRQFEAARQFESADPGKPNVWTPEEVVAVGMAITAMIDDIESAASDQTIPFDPSARRSMREILTAAKSAQSKLAAAGANPVQFDEYKPGDEKEFLTKES